MYVEWFFLLIFTQNCFKEKLKSFSFRLVIAFPVDWLKSSQVDFSRLTWVDSSRVDFPKSTWLRNSSKLREISSGGKLFWHILEIILKLECKNGGEAVNVMLMYLARCITMYKKSGRNCIWYTYNLKIISMGSNNCYPTICFDKFGGYIPNVCTFDCILTQK